MSNLDGTTIPAPTFPKLVATNYHSWKYDIQAMLQRNGTWGIACGLVARPTTTSGDEQDTWDKKNWNAAGVIYSYCDPSIQPLIRESLNSSKTMWNKLKELYEKDSAASRFLLMDEFFSMAKQPDETLPALCA